MKNNIHVLIRTIGRETMHRCIDSVNAQTYKDVKVHVYANAETIPKQAEWAHEIYIDQQRPIGFGYNLFCNTLKSQVEDGWFIFLDDDDYFDGPDVLEKLASHLTDTETAVICQFRRGMKIKPSQTEIQAKSITTGRIGMPCIVLHHSKKDIAHFDNSYNADFRFIKEISQKIKCKFIELVVINSPQRSHGK